MPLTHYSHLLLKVHDVSRLHTDTSISLALYTTRHCHMSTMKWYWMKYTLKRYHEYLELTNSNDNLCGVTRGGYDQHGNIDVAKEAPK